MGGVDVREISWIKWNFDCSNKEKGGLEVRRLRVFKMALLDKWCWRLKEEYGSLWVRVLSTRLWEVGHLFHVEGERGSMWWSNLVNISHGVTTSMKKWIYDNFVCEVGDRTTFLFWWDLWLDEGDSKEMNAKIFNNKRDSIHHLLDKIKVRNPMVS